MVDPIEHQKEFPLLKFALRTSVSDEILRKVGRNLVTLQQLERLLKALLPAREFKGRLSQIRTDFEAHVNGFATQTLGALVSTLKREPDEKRIAPVDEDIDTIAFRAELPWHSDEEKLTFETALDAITSSRNRLVHHFLPLWDSTQSGDAGETLGFLDEQYHRTLELQQTLLALGLRFDELRRTAAAFMALPEVEEAVESIWCAAQPLIQRLRELATEAQRPDGWTVLDKACAKLRTEDPSHLLDLKARFGHGKLTDLLRSVDGFELHEEATTRGGRRTLYRVRDSG